MKKRWLLTAVVCLAVLLVVSLWTGFWQKGPPQSDVIKVGFVYSEDASTPYTANFVRAQHALEEQFADKVEVLSRSNVLSRDAERPMEELIRAAADRINREIDSLRYDYRNQDLSDVLRLILLSEETKLLELEARNSNETNSVFRRLEELDADLGEYLSR